MLATNALAGNMCSPLECLWVRSTRQLVYMLTWMPVCIQGDGDGVVGWEQGRGGGDGVGGWEQGQGLTPQDGCCNLHLSISRPNKMQHL